MTYKAVLFAAILASLWPVPAAALDLKEETIPEELKPWVPWVLAELGEQVCETVGDAHRCVWPGRLSLDLTEGEGKFRQEVVTAARSMHELPGQRGGWPQEVLVDGKTAPVLERDGHPVVELTRGTHLIEGSFEWSRLPETLHIGQATAFLSLRISGHDTPLVKREGGNIWLKGLGSSTKLNDAPEQVELQVFRQLRDGVPLQVETVLVFQISGKARELSLDHPLLPSTVPLRVEGDLALALETSGTLRVQLLPGRHEVKILARLQGTSELIQNQKHAEPWPAQEVWTWHPDTQLRAVDVTGAPGIDASRTELPAEWRADSAFSVGAEDALRLTTTRRGQEQVSSNRINLRREFWLDETAQQFTVRDTLSGEMHQRWRLDLQKGELGQASLNNDTQLITVSTSDTKARGVEVRDTQLAMTAVSRLPRTGDLAAVGWSEDVDNLTATVHLPPGWQLFAATGVDDTRDTWLSRWDLFSVFYVLVLTLGVARLVRPLAGVVAALALVLSHGESGSPEYLWLPLLVLSALVVLIEKGRVQRWLNIAFYATALTLLLSFVSFAVDQVRAALYPHLNSTFADATDFTTLAEAPPPPTGEPAPADADVASEAAQVAVPEELMKSKRQTLTSPSAPASLLGGSADSSQGRAYGGKRSGSDNYQSQKQFKPDAIVQTGPGIPDVAGSSWDLTWSGPVEKEHTFQLYLIAPTVARVLTFLRLVLLGGLGWFLWRRVHRGNTTITSRAQGVSATVAGLALLGLVFMPRVAQADEPSDARLAELKERLLKPAACAPACLSVSALDLTLDDQLTAVAQVHAAAAAAYKLPGPASTLSEVELTVDGQRTSAVRLEADGAYYLRLEPGVHRVELRAHLTNDRTNLDVGTEPEQVRVRASGWTVTGVNDLGRVEGGTLTLQREVEVASTQGEDQRNGRAKSQVAVPPFYVIHRSISLFVTGQVTTHIERLSDDTTPEVLRLPLLPGERLTTPGIEVTGGIAVVPFPRQTREKILESTLVLPGNGSELALVLSAPSQSPTSETWQLQCGVVWHCTTQGITATSHANDGHSLWTFHPWPGERLELSAAQPGPAPGTSLTVQKATLSLTPGIRLAKGQLQMAIQTSRATVHTVKIPPLAKLNAVTVDGVVQAVKSDHGAVQISLAPGLRQVDVTWQESRGISSVFRSPSVNTGAAGVNFRTVLDLPERRWLLLAGGPAQGPAILLWGYLVLILGAALLLPRLPFAPLTSWQWILLGLGLTQVPSGVAVMVAGWFFAVGSRNKWPTLTRWRHNFLQLGLIGYTFTFLVVLGVAVYEGLVSSPDMEVTGAGSYGSHLVWVSDRSAGHFPAIWSLSLSIWIWRVFMLAWALWLSRSLLVWLKWAWGELTLTYFWAPKKEQAPTAKVSSSATLVQPSEAEAAQEGPEQI